MNKKGEKRNATNCKLLKHDSEILSTSSTFKQLRPHLKEDTFLEKIRGLQDNYGFNLVAVIENNEVKASAGYRVKNKLFKTVVNLLVNLFLQLL
ncbi:hypothetical protein CR203_19140 [Salipaludibacillus neizhouensis]|uniref:Uncharacterized protein n=1 Tax=Salipaludibacillus neizhouensis TaxID=885475 RepID=A0A3A9JXZ9_9BACI|nr:hypothetical protein [Salipaludibacillus neizhouensis]RKL65764.1 hypothetical protein CR203_19140 [Salipaludibacillus neizhouensis]